jgi:hypothetical protein
MPSNLEQAAEAVRRHQSEVDNAEATYNFHTKMAISAFDEVKKHRRNLEQAEKNLSRAASQTGAGVPAITPNNIKNNTLKVS